MIDDAPRRSGLIQTSDAVQQGEADIGIQAVEYLGRAEIKALLH